ncbi:MAG TPA: TonB-dependent receptor [Candidatus Saccharimonadales bacterium]|nr:TonB-dependent receptor [Candidatus Saccharimonadales bacterium]
MRKHSRPFLAPAVLLTVFLSIPLATAQITTGVISGVVVDEKGEPLPGVLITARNPETGYEQAVTSDSEGKYKFLAMQPAVYVLQATMEGYGAPLKTIVVNIGQITRANFALAPGAGLKEKVTVTSAPPLLNTTKSEVSTVVTEEEVRSYPLVQRDFNDLATLAPGVKTAPSGQFDPTKKQQIYSPYTTGGTAGRNINISIDGADNNDNVVGFFVQGFSLEAIQEFEVIQDQYKAEYGRSLGGVVNVITKSGTNDFGGSVFGYYNNENLRTKSFDEILAGASKSQEETEQYGLSFGGPILKNKLFYFATYEHRKDNKPLTLSPTLTSTASGAPPGYPFSIAAPGTTLGQDFKRDLWSLRIDWIPSKNHLVWARYSGDNTDALNDQGGSLVGPENQGTSTNRIWSGVVNWQWNVRPNMINELKIHHNDFQNRILSSSPDPILTLSYDNFDIGRNINTPQATIQKKFQLRDDFSWVSGVHTFKTGIEGIRVNMDDSFLGPSTTPALQFIFNPGVDPNHSMPTGDSNANGVDDGIEVINEVAPINPGFIPGTHYYQYGAYFQDDWEVSDRWRLNLGLRVDIDKDIFKDAQTGVNRDFYNCIAHPNNNAACGRDPNSAPPMGFDTFKETYPQDQTDFSPRIGFVYRVGGEDKNVLRGSWGLFYDKLLDNLVIFMRQNLSPYFSPALPTLDGCDITSDPTCSSSMLKAGTVVDPRLAPLPVDFTLNNWVDTSVTDPNGVNLREWFHTLTTLLGPATFDDYLVMPSPDWRTPYTSSYSVGWGHIFTPHLTLDTNLIYRRGFHQLRRQDYRGRNTGRQAPNAGGAMVLFTTDGKSEYVTWQAALRGRFPSLEFGINLNISQALGTQDNAGTAPTDGGPIDIFDGGNIRYTGGSVDKEWGRISGDQTFYTSMYGIYHFPHAFEVASQLAYASKTSYQGWAGVDINQDGFTSTNEYAGTRGAGLGDDLFWINMRGSKFWNLGAGTKLEGYIDIFNLLDRVNHGLYVIHQQLTVDNSGNVIINPDYGRPTGDTLTRPRTVQFGVRYTF